MYLLACASLQEWNSFKATYKDTFNLIITLLMEAVLLSEFYALRISLRSDFYFLLITPVLVHHS